MPVEKEISARGTRSVTIENSNESVIITGNIDFHQFVAAVRLGPKVRAPVSDFIGREKEVTELNAMLRRDGGVTICGINGLAGIGKTELALKVAEGLREDFQNQILIDLQGTSSNPLSPENVLARCIRAFVEVDAELPDDLESLQTMYLRELSEKWVLILLDNAANGKQITPLKPPSGCVLLVTSREKLWVAGMQIRTLEQLPPEKARDLLCEIAPRVNKPVSDRICYLCGYLPLAIRAAGGLLTAETDLKPTKYAEKLEEERKRLKLLETSDGEISVRASFKLSFDRLQAETARVFSQLAVFAPSSSFDGAAVDAICNDPDHHSLSELVRLNLVIYNSQEKCYQLHDLARVFADEQLAEGGEEMEAERKKLRLRHSAFFKDMLSFSDYLYRKGGTSLMAGLKLFDKHWRNTQAGQAWAEANAAVDDEAAQISIDYVLGGAAVLLLRQHPSERIKRLGPALDVVRRLKNPKTEGVVLGNLGTALRENGQVLDALASYEKALVIAREQGDRDNESVWLSNLGNCYQDLGRTVQATKYIEQALIVKDAISDRRGQAIDLNNLGNCYSDLGFTTSAKSHFENALALAREFGDRFTEGLILSSLADVLIDEDCYNEAIQYSLKGLEIGYEINSPAICIYNGEDLSLACLYSGNLPAARAYAESARQYDVPMNNENCLTLLGVVTLRQGEPVVAQDAFKKAIIQASKTLSHNPQHFQSLDAKGIAFSGLSLCENIVNIVSATDAFREARAINNDVGIVGRALRFFDALASADSAGILAEVRTACAGRSDRSSNTIE